MSEPIAPSAPKLRGKAGHYVAALLLALVTVAWYRSGSPRATPIAQTTVSAVAFSPDGTVKLWGVPRP